MIIKKHREFSVISYNLSRHQAEVEVNDLVKEHKPDFLCLQECRADKLPPTYGSLELAGSTNIGTQGLALYINKKRFEVQNIKLPALRVAFWKFVIKEPRQRLLIAQVYDKLTKQSLVIANFHATHLIASNYHRRIETVSAIKQLEEIEGETPCILIGDYNYPIYTKGLEKIVTKTGFNFAKPTEITFKGFGIQDYFDFASYKNIVFKGIQSLPFGISDHAPIKAIFSNTK